MTFDPRYFAMMRRSPFSGQDPNHVPQEGALAGDQIGPTGWYGQHSFSSFVGQANLLFDPTWELLRDGIVPIGTVETIKSFWAAHYVTNSGTAPTLIQFETKHSRTSSTFRPASTATTGLSLTFGTAATNTDIYIYSTSTDDIAEPALPVADFLVAAVRAVKKSIVGLSFLTAMTMRMEILNAGTLIASGQEWDCLAAAQYDYVQLFATTQQAAADFRAGTWRWRLRVHVEKAVTGSGTGVIETHWVEPQLHYAPIPDPLPFEPAIASWKQGVLWADLRLARVLARTVTGNKDDYDPAGQDSSTVLRLTPNAAWAITGIIKGYEGAALVLQNTSAFALTLKHDITSTAANRFYCPNNVDYVVNPNASVWIIYDGTALRWRVVAP